MAFVASVELVYEFVSLDYILRAKSPLISILIPGFKDIHGVQRILEKVPIDLVADSMIEILLSDDSPDFRVGKFVLDSNAFRFVTVFSGPGLGGAANWNFLLSKSNGRFVQFIHHDECPESPIFFKDLVRLCAQGPRILFHSCVLRRRQGDLLHCRLFIIKLALKYAPQYYLRRNIFGSPSNFCVPRSDLPLFNEKLIRYVDVDWYLRFSEDLHWSPTGLTMFSFENPDSITNQLVEIGLDKVESKEALMLRAEIPTYSLSVAVVEFFFFVHRAFNFFVLSAFRLRL